MDKIKYRIAMINKDTSEKVFWDKRKFSQNIDAAWNGTRKQADDEYKAAKKFTEDQYGCPCPHDIIIEDLEGRAWYIPGGVNIDA